jgi:hypothetical protein
MDGDFGGGGDGGAGKEGGVEFPVLDGAAGGLVEAEVTGAFEEVDLKRFAGGGDGDAEEDEALFAGEAGVFWVFRGIVVEIVGLSLSCSVG